MSTHHPIAIIGAGLGGLMLARVLRVHGVDAPVYDLDASASAHPQGGMLDIHEDSGQLALREAGLYDEFVRLIHRGGEAMRILDKHATLRLEAAGEGGRPEVNRGSLRGLLIGSLGDGVIRWGSKVRRAHTLADGRHEVDLADGTSFTADLLIGADGAWSKVRALVSDASPVYAGISFVEVHLLDADVRHADAAALVGGGVMFALSDGKGIIFHRDPDGRLHGYFALKTSVDWVETIDFADTAAAKALLLEVFKDWDERLRALIERVDGAFVPRPLYALTVGHRWSRTPGVTLVGDAAHLMSPFAGEGANLALQDGAELAMAIAAHSADTERAIEVYEQAMFPRSEASAKASADNLVVAFHHDAPQGMLDLMAQYARRSD